MLTPRPYHSMADVGLMQALLQTAPDPYAMFPTPTDLAEMFAASEVSPADATLLWERDGEKVGFSIVDRYHNLWFRFLPGALSMEDETALVAWAVEQVRSMTPVGEAATLDATARDDDAKRAFLARHGFVPGDTLTLYMESPIETPLPEPDLPAGWTVRPLAGEAEVPAYVAAHRAAYGTQYMTVEHRLAILRQPGYRPVIDLVLIASDGRLAAFCVCNIDDQANQAQGRLAGELGIIGVHPDFRRQGLGRAATLAGMRALQEQGMTIATLTVSSANTAALRIYEGLGFRVQWRQRWYAKPVV